MPSSNYTYTELNVARGTVNVIAVVKFHRAPVKTRGSGYSLFASLTDPSLSGDKLRCTFFHDSEERLPQIRAPGDVVVLHRLRVREFRGGYQGYGSASVGFAAAVFSGMLSDPLVPRISSNVCSYGEYEVKRVQELREWYHSPNCPVEHELPAVSTSVSGTTLITDCSSRNAVNTPVVRPWSLKLHQFRSIEGQVVGIYRYGPEARCLVVYLWDGAPASLTSTISPRFFGPKRDMSRLLRSCLLDPRVAITAGHRSRVVDDWSIPVFLYDEHSTFDVRPGDLVRIHNIHVLPCRESECDIPKCLRLMLHGGGHSFHRGVESLGSSSLISPVNQSDNSPITSQDQRSADDNPRENANQYGMLRNLELGYAHRPCYLRVICDELQTYLTIAQICSIPTVIHRDNAERFFTADLPSSLDSAYCLPIPRSSWLSLDEPVHSNRTSVAVRLYARVFGVFPTSVTDLKNSLVLACQRCRSATRLSSVLDANEEPCECGASSPTSNTTLGEVPKRVICPFVWLKLEDPTGQLLVCAAATSGIALLTRTASPSAKNPQWIQLANELLGSNTTDAYPVASKLLRQLSDLMRQPVDLVLRMSWLTEWDLVVPTSLDQLDVRYELLNERSLIWSTLKDN